MIDHYTNMYPQLIHKPEILGPVQSFMKWVLLNVKNTKQNTHHSMKSELHVSVMVFMSSSLWHVGVSSLSCSQLLLSRGQAFTLCNMISVLESWPQLSLQSWQCSYCKIQRDGNLGRSTNRKSRIQTISYYLWMPVFEIYNHYNPRIIITPAYPICLSLLWLSWAVMHI